MTASSIRDHVQRGSGRACVLAGVLVLLALVPLAQASPPDPLWLAGIYDAADADDAIQVVTDGFGFQLPANDGPIRVTRDTSTSPIGFAVPAPPPPQPRSSRVDRAPPRL